MDHAKKILVVIVFLVSCVHGYWSVQLGPPGTTTNPSLMVFANDRLHVVATNSGGGNWTASFDPAHGTDSTVYLRYKLDGTVEHIYQFGLTSVNVRGTAIAVDNTGAVFITGSNFGNLNGATNNGLQDIYVVRLFNDIVTHTVQIGTSGFDGPGSLAIDTDGNVLLGGQVAGAMNGQTFAGGSSDALLMKLSNSDLSTIWTRLYGTSASDSSESIHPTSSYIYVAGSTSGAFPGETSIGSTDVFAMRMSKTGVLQWVKQFGGTGGHSFLGDNLILYGDSLIFCAQTSGNWPGHTLQGSSDSVLLELSVTDGSLKWQNVVSRPGYFTCSSVTMNNGVAYMNGIVDRSMAGVTISGKRTVYVQAWNVNKREKIIEQVYPSSNEGFSRAAVFAQDKMFLLWTAEGVVNEPITVKSVAVSFVYDPCPVGSLFSGHLNDSLPGTATVFQKPNVANVTKQCIQCGINTFANTTWATSCLDCPLGSVAPNNGSSTCVPNFPTAQSLNPNVGQIGKPMVVEITGVFIQPNDNATMLFANGTKVVLRNCQFISQQMANCTLPAIDSPQTIKLFYDFTNGQSTAPSLSVVNSTVHHSVSPVKMGPISGATPITVTGNGFFVSASSPRCQFKLDLMGPVVTSSVASVSSASRLTCSTPTFPSTGTYRLGISMNTQNFLDVIDFNVFNVTLQNAQPISVLVTGQSLVLHGKGFPANDSPRVRITDTVSSQQQIVNGNSTSSSLIEVQMPGFNAPPAGTNRKMNIEVSFNNGQQFTGGIINVFGYNDHGIGAISPTSLPLSVNGLDLLITSGAGKLFTNTSVGCTVRLQRNGKSIDLPGIITTNTQTRVKVDTSMAAGFSPGQWKLSLSQNGQVFSNQVNLAIFNVTQVEPLFTPQGGTVITVHGNGFLGGVPRCRFGSEVVVASIISVSKMTCTTPSLIKGNLSVSVSTNAQTFTPPAFNIVSDSNPTVSSVTPNNVPRDSMQQVAITGSGFINTANLVAKFGNVAQTPCQYVSSTQITCMTPQLTPGSFPVFVALNGQQFGGSGSVALNALQSTTGTITPSSGPLTGGTVITIDGSGFLSNSSLIQAKISSLSINPVVIVTTVNLISNSRLTLTMPSFVSFGINIGSSGTHLVSISVSNNNGLSFGPSSTWTLFSRPVFSSVTPGLAIATGGTRITIAGRAPQLTTTTLMLRDTVGNWTVLPKFEWQPENLQLTVPEQPSFAGSPRNVSMHLALNGQQYVEMPVRFIMFGRPSILSVSPASKVPTDTVLVTIQGTGFIQSDAVRVRMGQQLFVPVSMTESSIVVSSPETQTRGEHFVSVALDGQIFNGNGVVFTVLTGSIQCPENTEPIVANLVLISQCQCKVGFFESTATAGRECKPCPSGASCPGRLLQPKAKPGFFRKADDQFLQCPNPEACLGGGSGCKTGHEGLLCAKCSPDWYQISGRCLRCEETSSASFFLLAILLVAYVFWVKAQVRSASRNTGRLISIAVTHMQIVSTFGRYSVTWPDQVSQGFDVLSVVNFNLQIAAPECSSVDWSLETRFWVTMLMPLVLFALLLIRVILQFVHASLVRQWGLTFEQRFPNFCAEPDADISKIAFFFSWCRFQLSTFFTHAEIVDMETLKYLVNELLLTLGLLYIPLATRVLEVVDCTDLGGGTAVLDMDPNEICWSFGSGSLQDRLFVPAVVFGIFYVIGIPLTYIIIMIDGRKKSRRLKPSFQTRYSILFVRFDEDFFAFELVIIVRKLLMVAVQLYSTRYPIVQTVFGLIVMVSMSLLHFSTLPFATNHQNRLESMLMLHSLTLLINGIVFGTINDDAQQATLQTMSNFTVAVIILVVLISVLYFLFDFLNSFTERQELRSRDPTKEESIENLVSVLNLVTKRRFNWKLERIMDKRFTKQEIKSIQEFVMDVSKNRLMKADESVERVTAAALKVVHSDLLTVIVSRMLGESHTAGSEEFRRLMEEVTNDDRGTVLRRLLRGVGEEEKGKQDLELTEL